MENIQFIYRRLGAGYQVWSLPSGRDLERHARTVWKEDDLYDIRTETG